MKIYKSGASDVEDPVKVAEGVYDPFSATGIQFSITEPGTYFANCQRLTTTGDGLGPVITSNSVEILPASSGTYSAPLVISLSI